MGQAKQRRTFEKRQAQAIQRNKIKELKKLRNPRPKRKSQLNTLLSASLAIEASTQ